MRSCTRALISAAFAAVFLLLSMQPAAAASTVTWGTLTPDLPLNMTETLQVRATVTLDEPADVHLFATFASLDVPRLESHFDGLGVGVHDLDFSISLQAFAANCVNGTSLISFEGGTVANGTYVEFDVEFNLEYACNYTPPSPGEPVYPDLLNLDVYELCGDANDDVSFSQTGVVTTLGDWIGNNRTIYFDPADGYFFPDGAIRSHDVVDKGVCTIELFPGPVQIENCGNNNDTWDFGNDIPHGGSGRAADEWVDNYFWFSASARDGWQFSPGQQTLFEYTDAGPCEVEGLLPPVHAEICGVNNDSVTVPEAPDGVTVTNSDEWSVAGIWTVAYTVENENYRLPDGVESVYVFTDTGDCIVTPVLPSEFATVCGPNNDVITIPGQLDGVIVTDSGWLENRRNIAFSAADGYVFPQESGMGLIAEDLNTSCDVEPEGKQLTVILDTSDGGSIEGTEFEVFASSASQVVPGPYANGVVGPNNRIVLEGLIAGNYRLVTAPEGYEPVDAVLSVTEGTDAQEITVDVAAIQVVPTPEPTAEPTQEPTAEPIVVPTQAPITPEPTIEPTQEQTTEPIVLPTQAPITPEPESNPTTAAVSGLPETGSGSSNSASVIASATLVLLFAVVAGAFVSRKKLSGR